MKHFFQKLRSLLHRHRKEKDLRDELQFHLDEEAEERQAEGLPGEEARRAACLDFGNITLVQEETRAAWPGRLFSSRAPAGRWRLAAASAPVRSPS